MPCAGFGVSAMQQAPQRRDGGVVVAPCPADAANRLPQRAATVVIRHGADYYLACAVHGPCSFPDTEAVVLAARCPACDAEQELARMRAWVE